MKVDVGPSPAVPIAALETARNFGEFETLWRSRGGRTKHQSKRRLGRRAASTRELVDGLRDLARYDDRFAPAIAAVGELGLLGTGGSERLEAMRRHDRELTERLSCIVEIGIYRAAGMPDLPAFRRAAAVVPVRASTFLGAWKKARRHWVSYRAASVGRPPRKGSSSRPALPSTARFVPSDLQLWWMLPDPPTDGGRHTCTADLAIAQVRRRTWCKLGAFLRYTTTLRRHPPDRVFRRICAIGGKH